MTIGELKSLLKDCKKILVISIPSNGYLQINLKETRILPGDLHREETMVATKIINDKDNGLELESILLKLFEELKTANWSEGKPCME